MLPSAAMRAAVRVLMRVAVYSIVLMMRLAFVRATINAGAFVVVAIALAASWSATASGPIPFARARHGRGLYRRSFVESARLMLTFV
jgi:hypothetical protein